jgi:hypothetical protein
VIGITKAAESGAATLFRWTTSKKGNRIHCRGAISPQETTNSCHEKLQRLINAEFFLRE